VRISAALTGVAVLWLTFVTAAHAQVVTKVPSGDTVVIEGVGKVRLLGIRSTDESALRVGPGTTPPPQPRTGPETPPPSVISGGVDLKPDRPARALLQQLVLGKTVRLQYDTIAGEKNASRAYVFLPDDTLINAEMLRRGRARVDASGPFAHEQEFKRLEQEAQASGLGIWTNVSPK
jgi:endonuclease YncB( thermonuclease family)